jgi:ribosomal protein S18 acetylase RimI-like enzyme
VITTHNFDEAMAWSREAMGELNVAPVWIPRSRFVRASRVGQSISITRESNDGEFGLSTSLELPIEESWSEFVLPQSISREDVLARGQFRFEDSWQTHGIVPTRSGQAIEVLEDDNVVEQFLATHAPQSSARPGNPEIHFWACVRNEQGEIAAVAAITEWESGESMLSSVATHTEMRGLGYAKKVVEGILRLACDRNYDRINLVVLSNNLPAIKVYESIGFTLMGKFNTFTRI